MDKPNQTTIEVQQPAQSPATASQQSTDIKAPSDSTIVVSPDAQTTLINTIAQQGAGIGIGFVIVFGGTIVAIKFLGIGSALGTFIEAQRKGSEAIHKLADSLEDLAKQMCSVTNNQERGLGKLDRLDTKIDHLSDGMDDLTRLTAELNRKKEKNGDS